MLSSHLRLGKQKVYFTENVLILSLLLSETFLILRKIQRYIVNVNRSSCKVLVIVRFH